MSSWQLLRATIDLGRNRIVHTGNDWRPTFRMTRLLPAYVAMIRLLGMALGLMVSERHWAVATGPVILVKTLLLTRLMRSAPLRTTAGVRSIA